MGIRNHVISALTLGSQPQSFLGARWIRPSLRLLPSSKSTELALRYISMSPHYFYRTEKNAHLELRAFLQSERDRNAQSRTAIIETVVLKYLQSDFVLLDYGCGPGFLAAAASRRAAKVYACDIADGILACAEILNGAANIEYRAIPASGKIPIADASIDLVYSFAVIQHVTDEVFEKILREWRRIVKPGGRVLCHIVLDDSGWKPEQEWRGDTSVNGKLKWYIGLHCFGRTRRNVEEQFVAAGLAFPEIVPISDFNLPYDDDICRQHLCVSSVL